MKTKLSLALLFSFIILSCTKTYEQELYNDALKPSKAKAKTTKFIQNKDDIGLTSTNLIYEEELYKYYLDLEISKLENTIKEIEGLSPKDKDYYSQQKRLPQLKDSLETFSKERAITPGFAGLGEKYWGRVRPPIPPAPDVMDYLKYFVVNNVTADLKIYDANGKLVANSEGKLTQFPEARKGIMYGYINNELKYTKGSYLFKVTRINSNNEVVSYSMTIKPN